MHINPAPVDQQSSRVFCLIGLTTEQFPAPVSLIGSIYLLPGLELGAAETHSDSSQKPPVE
ncbi:hypothetical protein DENIT_12991 [Pseudomonas veronii]|nr:hypothetical protein DENIT_12991 [Pseudomonas veronii]